jgi:putative phosphoesterase
MERALVMHPDTDFVFFLGDGLSDFEILMKYHENIPYAAVSGNCDFSKKLFSDNVPRVKLVEINNKKILLTHGDMFFVKEEISLLVSHAKSLGADIALFGHTHIPYENYLPDSNIYLFNPGSITYNQNSFGILTLTDDTVLFSCGSLCRTF